MSGEKNALCMMAKAPVPRRVKSRLCPPLSPEAASFLYHQFLRDTLALAAGVTEADPFVSYTPKAAAPYFAAVAPARFRRVQQPAGTLGDRLAHTALTRFGEGYGRVLLLGSDTPHLPVDYLREGLLRLEEADITLGPCDDGGYYLIGLRLPAAGVFAGIPWSTADVLRCTVRRAEEEGLAISLLPPWYDLDRIADLARLRHDIETGVLRGGLHHTRRALSHPSIAPLIPDYPQRWHRPRVF
jgi:rSAM/selenodomain-associated transferase 1